MELKKYDENKIFVTGISGAGKTTFSQNYSKNYNKRFIDFDNEWSYGSDPNEQYNIIVKKYGDDFITDAIPYATTDGKLNFSNYYQENKDDIKVVCLCCTNKEDFDNRILSKHFGSKVKSYSDYHEFYFKTLKNIYSNFNVDYIDTSTNEYITEDELYKRLDWINSDNIKKLLKDNFMNYLHTQQYDKFYQDIDCINYIGYSSSHRSWNTIKDLVDWKGKKVADLGCFHGYFSLKMAKLGAQVTSMDNHDGVLATCGYINQIEGNLVETKYWNGGDEVSSDYDVTLALNVIHHFKDTEKSLQNIKSKTVIFETNQNLIDLISKYFTVVKKLNSHRPDATGKIRTILLCERK